MTPIKIPLDFQQLAVVVTANLKLGKPYELNIRSEGAAFSITVDDERMGCALVHSVEIIRDCFEKNHRLNSLGDVCNALVTVFGRYGFSSSGLNV